MTSDQIKKLAAAGLTVEQIAVVAEVMEPQNLYINGIKMQKEQESDKIIKLWQMDLTKGHTAIAGAILKRIEDELALMTDGNGFIHLPDGSKLLGGPGQVFLEQDGNTIMIGDNAGPPELSAVDVAFDHFIKAMNEKDTELARLSNFMNVWNS